jgi:hypothetical protein
VQVEGVPPDLQRVGEPLEEVGVPVEGVREAPRVRGVAVAETREVGCDEPPPVGEGRQEGSVLER